jgi:dolichol-phosphate mannosyltransferase
MKKITVLIPCFNEARGIAEVIRRLPFETAEKLGFEIHVLVIDNNSTDNTAEIAQAAGAQVIHEPRQGKGNAVRTGFYNIPEDTDYVVMLDGDATYRPEEILRMIEPIDSGFSHVITGSRMDGKLNDGAMHPFNRLGNRMYSKLVRVTYNVPVTDVLTGYYAWSHAAIKDLRSHIRAEGFAIEMEMVTKLARLGYDIYCVPISYEPRIGDSSLRPLRDGYRIMKMFARNLRWKPDDGTSDMIEIEETITDETPKGALPHESRATEDSNRI